MNAYESWREERSSAYLYRLLAAKESGVKQQMFSQLADAAEEQSTIWLNQWQKDGKTALPAYQPDWRTRLMGWFIKKMTVRQLRYILPAMKIRGMSVYQTVLPGHAMPVSLEDVGLRHKKTGASGNLRAAVFGVNDGLVSNMSLILGMAGAAVSDQTILLAGIAGLLAGAFSMAAGEFVSVKSQREMLEHQISLERDELALYPEEESAELALIYEARGLSSSEAKKIANQMISNPEHALDVLTREELGLNPEELGSPLGAGIFSFCAFSGGALIPLLPYLFHAGNISLWLSMTLTAFALFLVGASIGLFTGRSIVWGGLRMLLIGSAAGILTYGVGYFFGVAG